MKTADFNNQITSSKLHENLEKQFGSKVNLEKYGREQLEDIRNKLRTRTHQAENKAGYNDLLNNELYQKDKAMLELLNTRIKEMLGEQMQKLRDKMDALNENKKSVKTVKKSKGGAKPDFLDLDKDGNKTEPMKSAAKSAKVKEGAKPDFLDLDKDGDKKEPMKKAAKEKNVKEEMKVGDKKQSSTGGTIEKTKTGVKHTAGNNYGAEKQPWDEKGKKSKKVAILDKDEDDLDEGKAHAKNCDCKECMGTMEGKDEGKPGKNFAKIAKSAGKRYGSKEAGERVAGAVRAKLAKQGKLEESNFKHNVRFVNESLQFLLAEDEEGKAKAITAAGDIVNDYTSWMQRVGQYQTKSMIELADAIRADFGAAEAEQFKNAVGPALSQTLEVLTQQREAVSNAVAVLAGEATPEEPMGMEPDMGAGEPGMDASAPDEMNPDAGADLGDEFGASDAAAGGDVTAGREMRESRQQVRARKLAESHSIMAKLAK